MDEQKQSLRALLEADRPILAPGAWDPLTARLLERQGFECLMVGGWITGASQAITEPLLTMSEQVQVAGSVARAVDIPVIADGHTGYGDPVHVMRAIREYEAAGIAAIHIEDQLFPKRAHYHRNVKHVIPTEEMVEKIRFAVQARRDPEFVVIARTDANDAVGGSLEEAITRLRAYKHACADALMPFPSPGENPESRNLDVARRLREAVPDVPLIWLAGETGSADEPTAEEIYAAGYQIIMFPISVLLKTAAATIELAGAIRACGQAVIADQPSIQAEVEAAIGLDALYQVESATTEGGS